VLSIGLFVVGGVGGYAWALDREIRGGILHQRVEAEARPDWVTLAGLPRYVPEAFLAVVEPELLTRSEMRAPAETPTLARELVRQVHLLPGSIAGQSRERFMGPVLEKRLSRTDLLELYLNRVYLGQAQGYPVYGVYHASREYFEKLPEDLTLGEGATLAALLLEPRIADPAGRVGAVGARRSEVLRVMLLGELITREQYERAIAEPLGFQPGLEQMPMSRPADWGEDREAIRLPPEWRPSPTDSAAPGS
jgi:penicillin-binding protein 1A